MYTWTGENRLRKLETRSGLPAGVPNLTLEFKYDHMGRRIHKVVKENGTTVEDRRYVWHGWRLLWELDSSSALKKLYTWGPDASHTLEGAGTVGGLLSVMDVSGAWDSWVSFPCYDGNGNVMGLAGYAYGNILCKYEYDPYGKLIRTSGNTALAASNPFLFSTKFLDRETGLSYYGYRYYSSEKGRWVNRDPIGEAGGLNINSSFLSDGVNSIDALGHIKWTYEEIPGVPEMEMPIVTTADGKKGRARGAARTTVKRIFVDYSHDAIVMRVNGCYIFSRVDFHLHTTIKYNKNHDPLSPNGRPSGNTRNHEFHHAAISKDNWIALQYWWNSAVIQNSCVPDGCVNKFVAMYSSAQVYCDKQAQYENAKYDWDEYRGTTNDHVLLKHAADEAWRNFEQPNTEVNNCLKGGR